MLNILLKRRYDFFDGKSGDRFGRLVLTGESYIKQAIGHRGRVVEAVCDCGEVKWYWYHLVRNGETQSCGCYRKQVSKKRLTTHNLSAHPLYDVYKKMIERCYKETDKAYKNYGGRGIEVWKDWVDDFMEFYQWSIDNGYKEGLSLDRNNNDGNYAPNNCSWATPAQQSRNRRSSRNYTAFGETKCLFDWGADSRCLVSVWTLRGRMDKPHWEGRIEEAMTIKDDSVRAAKNSKSTKQLTAFGETMCLTDWSKDKRCVVGFDRLRDRIAWGWDHEKAISTIQEDSKEIKLTAFGESKSMTNWLKDERCVVKRDALRDRYRKGWSHEDCVTIPSKTGVKNK